MRTPIAIAIALLVASLAAQSAVADRASPGPDTLTLVVVGDVGLNRSNLPVDAKGVREGSGVLAWKDMSAGVRDLITGDLNFMNVETVVTDRNNLKPGNKGQKKPYLFRSHPAGIAHLVDVGFNLLSLANNHSYDYGEQGVRETVKHLEKLAAKKRMHWAGVGLDRKSASAPTTFQFKGARVAFSSLGIVTNMIKAHRATDKKPGSMGYRYEEDWKLVANALAAARADLRLLSIHYGKERQIKSEPKQLEEWRWAAREKNVDVVIGHHAHVVRGIELHKGKLIFYGLGNFMIRGARDMGADPQLKMWGDFGLYAKVHMIRNGSGGYTAKAIEIVPLTDMHREPKRFSNVAESKKRVEVLNVLAGALDDSAAGSVGVRFAPQSDGSGLHCVAGAASAAGPIGSLCRGWKAPGKPSAEVARIVGAKLRGKRSKGSKRKKRRRGRK